MNLPFSPAVTLVAYAVTWVLLHLGCGYAAHLVPSTLLHPAGILDRLLASRRWEAGGTVYRHMGVNRWKGRLPEAGALYPGGFNKRHLEASAGEQLRRFRLETNRAELSHWLTLASSLTFFAWNPWWVGLFMLGYAVITNLPFILVQRFNRPRLAALAARKEHARSTSRAAGASTARWASVRHGDGPRITGAETDTSRGTPATHS